MSETGPGAAPPSEVLALAGQRRAARADRDFSRSDALRDEIAAAGWLVKDTAEGFELAPRPPFEVLADVSALPDRSAEGGGPRAVVALLVDGWPDDVRTCVEALLAHLPDDVVVVGLDQASEDGAGLVLHELATAHPQRVRDWHVARAGGWAAGFTALLRAEPCGVFVTADPSSVLTGDALSPLLEAIEADTSVVGAGWRGVNADLDDAWRSFADAGPGEVDALLGYLAAFRRDALLAVGGPDPKARFYRNADIELSLMLREAGGRLVAPVAADALPVRQDRHRGYHEGDPVYRDKQSKKTYDRILQRFRGHDEILAPRS
jgi:hypothetical protein